MGHRDHPGWAWGFHHDRLAGLENCFVARVLCPTLPLPRTLYQFWGFAGLSSPASLFLKFVFSREWPFFRFAFDQLFAWGTSTPLRASRPCGSDRAEQLPLLQPLLANSLGRIEHA